MVERINLANIDSVGQDVLRGQICQIVTALLAEENIPLSETERTALEQEVLNETFGLGPIEPYLHDCKFNDCIHEKEPDCAVKAAVERGDILPWRYESYQRILESLRDDGS